MDQVVKMFTTPWNRGISSKMPNPLLREYAEIQEQPTDHTSAISTKAKGEY
jgi:hypothetical protein